LSPRAVVALRVLPVAAVQPCPVALAVPPRDSLCVVAGGGPMPSVLRVFASGPGSGAAAELGPDAITVNPYDISGTAAALHEALAMPEDERLKRGRRLAAAATALPPRQWLAEQLAALG